jgi:pimeloyl-ACP methyl ester carboxylesterase
MQNDTIEDKVDVGGFKLFYKCMGKGTPTVVLDAGLNHGSDDWRYIQPEIAKITRVFAYDRAGRGQSDPGPFPRTSRVIVGELDRLLTRAAIDGPYVLVGNSFGAFNLRLYAHHFPEKVKGMVIIDCPHQDLYPRFKAICPPEVWEQFVDMQENNEEGVSIMQNIAELAGMGSLGDRPLAVLTGSYLEYPAFISKELAKQGWQIWQELHSSSIKKPRNILQSHGSG